MIPQTIHVSVSSHINVRHTEHINANSTVFWWQKQDALKSTDFCIGVSNTFLVDALGKKWVCSIDKKWLWSCGCWYIPLVIKHACCKKCDVSFDNIIASTRTLCL